MTNLNEMNKYSNQENEKKISEKSISITETEVTTVDSDKNIKSSPIFEVFLLSKGIEFYLINDLTAQYYPII